MENTRKKYSTEFKICAAAMSTQYGSILRVAQELGISRHNLQHWKKIFNDGKPALKKTSDTDTDRNELSRLRKEIKDLKQERDILKKARSIFSRRDGSDMNLSGKTLVNFPS